jgi:hypothetical protein
MKTCATCKTPLDDEALFCSACGADVRGQESGAEAIPSPESRIPHLESRTPSSDDLDTDIEMPSVSSIIQPATVRAAVASMPGPLSECGDLELYYDASRIFMEGLILPFAFRLAPQCDGLTDLSLEIRTQSGLNESKRVLRVLRPGVEREISVDMRMPEGCSGMMTFDFILRYRQGRADRMFMISRTHEVHPQRNARKVFENFRIEINQGHAGDINQNFQGLEKLMQNEDWEKVFSKMNIPPRWEKLALEECADCESSCTVRLPLCPASARLERLTLQIDGWKVHLLSGERIQLGRDRTCDLVTRVFDVSGAMPREANLAISRRQCGLVNPDGQVQVVNGDLSAAPGGKAVYLNGHPVETQESLTDEFLLTFGGPQPEPGLFGFKGRKVNLSDGTAGVILMRTDSVKEIFVPVYERVRLGLADPRWGELCVCRQDGGFALSAGPGFCTWLQPGASHTTAAGPVRVLPYSQEGL